MGDGIWDMGYGRWPPAIGTSTNPFLIPHSPLPRHLSIQPYSLKRR